MNKNKNVTSFSAQIILYASRFYDIFYAKGKGDMRPHTIMLTVRERSGKPRYIVVCTSKLNKNLAGLIILMVKKQLSCTRDHMFESPFNINIACVKK